MNALEIKKRRKELGLNQEDLAKKLGVSLKTISNYENGEVIPETKQALLLEILSNNTLEEPISVYKKTGISFEEKIKQVEEKIKNTEEVIKHNQEIIKLLRFQIEIIKDAQQLKEKDL
jgi:transcriptional regulator with XRE-family HTH domain